MRILTFTNLFPDSTRRNFGVFIYQRMAHFAQRPGNSVVVVTPVPYVPFWMPGKKATEYRAVPAKEQFGELTVYHPRYPFLPKISMQAHGLLMFLGSYQTVKRLVRDGIDCIDSHFVYPDSFAAVMFGKLFKIPVFASARGTDMNAYPKFASVRPMIRWTLRNAQGLIGVCSALSDAMVEMGAPRERVYTIGNGVDSGRFNPQDRNDARKQLGIPLDKKMVVAVGALIPRKGYHFLIPAIGMLKQRGLDVKLYVNGEGDYRPKLEQQIRELNLGESVTLTGSVPNDRLKYWYSAADVSCLASSAEGWANVLLESMACGTPVVATRIWGTPEVVTSDRLGLLVEQNPQSLADGLESALSRSWDREHIAKTAQARSWEVVAAEVEQAFFDITKASAASPDMARANA